MLIDQVGVVLSNNTDTVFNPPQKPPHSRLSASALLLLLTSVISACGNDAKQSPQQNSGENLLKKAASPNRGENRSQEYTQPLNLRQLMHGNVIADLKEHIKKDKSILLTECKQLIDEGVRKQGFTLGESDQENLQRLYRKILEDDFSYGITGGFSQFKGTDGKVWVCDQAEDFQSPNSDEYHPERVFSQEAFRDIAQAKEDFICARIRDFYGQDRNITEEELIAQVRDYVDKDPMFFRPERNTPYSGPDKRASEEEKTKAKNESYYKVDHEGQIAAKLAEEFGDRVSRVSSRQEKPAYAGRYPEHTLAELVKKADDSHWLTYSSALTDPKHALYEPLKRVEPVLREVKLRLAKSSSISYRDFLMYVENKAREHGLLGNDSASATIASVIYDYLAQWGYLENRNGLDNQHLRWRSSEYTDRAKADFEKARQFKARIWSEIKQSLGVSSLAELDGRKVLFGDWIKAGYRITPYLYPRHTLRATLARKVSDEYERKLNGKLVRIEEIDGGFELVNVSAEPVGLKRSPERREFDRQERKRIKRVGDYELPSVKAAFCIIEGRAHVLNPQVKEIVIPLARKIALCIRDLNGVEFPITEKDFMHTVIELAKERGILSDYCRESVYGLRQMLKRHLSLEDKYGIRSDYVCRPGSEALPKDIEKDILARNALTRKLEADLKEKVGNKKLLSGLLRLHTEKALRAVKLLSERRYRRDEIRDSLIKTFSKETFPGQVVDLPTRNENCPYGSLAIREAATFELYDRYHDWSYDPDIRQALWELEEKIGKVLAKLPEGWHRKSASQEKEDELLATVRKESLAAGIILPYNERSSWRQTRPPEWTVLNALRVAYFRKNLPNSVPVHYNK